MGTAGDDTTPVDAVALREACREAARAIAAVSSQVDLALREAEPPVTELSAGIARVVAAAEALRRNPALANDPNLAVIAGFVHGAIEHMQFYDRMSQHLGHVYDYMMAIAARVGDVADNPAIDPTPEAARAEWEALRARFYSRLLTEPQRQLFDMLLPPDTGSTGRMRLRADLGSIELF